MKPFAKTTQQQKWVHLSAIGICAVIAGIAWALWPEPQPTEHLAMMAQPSDNSVSTSHITKAVENWITYTTRQDDTLQSLLRRAGVSAPDQYAISQVARTKQLFSDIEPGQTLAFQILGGHVNKLRYDRDALHSVEISRSSTDFRVKTITRTPEILTHLIAGRIRNSLSTDLYQAGLPKALIPEVVRIISWDTGVTSKVHQHDPFRVLYQERLIDGRKIDNGKILAVELINHDSPFTALSFTDEQGRSGYFGPDGTSVQKSFLRAPLEFSRISSPFSHNRLDPVLGVWRPHLGVDYAAVIGTPIKAVAAGKIIWRDRKGGYGRTIIIQHGGDVTTLYAHMSRYSRGLHIGSQVQQGEVIGYVGQSGLTTGPHLHYEYLIGGVHKNPVTVKLPQAAPIAKRERDAFSQHASQLLAELNRTSPTIALSDHNGNNG